LAAKGGSSRPSGCMGSTPNTTSRAAGKDGVGNVRRASSKQAAFGLCYRAGSAAGLPCCQGAGQACRRRPPCGAWCCSSLTQRSALLAASSTMRCSSSCRVSGSKGRQQGGPRSLGWRPACIVPPPAAARRVQGSQGAAG
jgi:hypothetical protein